MKVLVIGATGYIGSAVAEALRSGGHQVSAIARSSHAREVLESRGYDIVEGDAAHPHSLFAPARAADAIVYAVSVTDADPFAVDSQALRQLIEAAKSPAKRLLYTSGVWVYGDTGPVAATEDAPLHPPPLVARRPELERLVLDAAAGGAHPIVIRPGIVYGHRAGVPMMFVNSAHERGAATIVGDGTNHWACIHVDDLARLYLSALQSAPSAGVYNATDGTSYTVQEIAKAASRGSLKDGNVALIPAAAMGHFGEALALDQRVSSERARHELGWEPSAPPIVDDLEHGSYALTPSSAT